VAERGAWCRTESDDIVAGDRCRKGRCRNDRDDSVIGAGADGAPAAAMIAEEESEVATLVVGVEEVDHGTS
jgi:hypothetical protein